MKHPKIQHYVPQFILRRFAHLSKHIYVFDKWTGKNFLAAINKTAAENYYYDFNFSGIPVTIEPMLARIESIGSKHIDKIIREAHIDIDNPLIRAELAVFLAAQSVRTPAQFMLYNDFFSRLKAYLLKQGVPEAFFVPDSLVGDDENEQRALRAKWIEQALEEIPIHFYSKDWTLLKTDLEHPFMIGDNPVCLHNFLDQNSYRSMHGLKHKGISMYFPLSPKFALGLFCSSYQEERKNGMEKLYKKSQIRSMVYQAM